MNKKSFIWLIPVLVITLAMSACGGDSGGGGAANLNFAGEQVYTKTMSPYTGADKTLTSGAGGTGSITGGKMSFSVGTPSRLVPMESFLVNMSDDFHIFSDAEFTGNTNAAELSFSPTLYKAMYSSLLPSLPIEAVRYVYVDRDCTITAAGKTVNYGVIPVTVSNLNLSLKQGWNAINSKIALTTTGSTVGGTVNIRTGDSSSCKWILE